MPALAAFVGGMAQGRLQEHAAQDKMKIDEAKIAAQAKAKREGELNKRIASVSQVIEEISARNPDATPGDLRQLNVNLMKMPATSYAEIEKRVFSSDPEQGYTLTGGRVMGKRKPKPIVETGKEANMLAISALNGELPQFNEAMKRHGMDVDDLTSAASDKQIEIMRQFLGSQIQQQAGQGVPHLRAAVSLAPELAKITTHESSWWPGGDSMSIRWPGTAPVSTQVDRGGGVRDWSVDNLYSWGGRMWRWLGGPEGPRHNPEGHNPNMWEAAS